MAVPRSILSDFGVLFGSRFGTTNVENPASAQQLDILFFNLAFLLPKCALREHLQMLKKLQKQWRVVQKQCVSQIGICDNSGRFWLSF